MRRFYEGVTKIPSVKVYGDFSTDDRAAIVALNIGDYDSSEVSDELAVTYGISTRPGAHCCLLYTSIADFVKNHGMTGWAPTQGHIPSGVPYLGLLRDEILAGETKRAMIIGKGSLFLGRMTNLFDGVSFVVQANDGSASQETGVDEGKVTDMIGQAMRAFAEGLLGDEE